MSDELSKEAYWAGALAMGLAIAHQQLDLGRAGVAQRVIHQTLERYMKSDRCNARLERRLRRNSIGVPEEVTEDGLL